MSRLLGFVDRIGGVLVEPRATVARVAAGGDGLGDVVVLLAAKVLADRTDLLARAALGVRSRGPAVALQGALQAAASVLPDTLGILVAAVALALFGGAGRGRGAARELDLAAYCWVPWLALHVVFALAHTALQRPAGDLERALVDGAALLWSLAVWALSLRALRRAPAEAAP